MPLASRVEPLEELIDDLCDELKLHHVDRLQKGTLYAQLNGFLFNDLLTNYERVADHCSNIAVAMIELESDSFDTHEYLSQHQGDEIATPTSAITRNTASNTHSKLHISSPRAFPSAWAFCIVLRCSSAMPYARMRRQKEVMVW